MRISSNYGVSSWLWNELVNPASQVTMFSTEDSPSSPWRQRFFKGRGHNVAFMLFGENFRNSESWYFCWSLILWWFSEQFLFNICDFSNFAIIPYQTFDNNKIFVSVRGPRSASVFVWIITQCLSAIIKCFIRDRHFLLAAKLPGRKHSFTCDESRRFTHSFCL